MNVLITGVAGFVGRHLAELCVAEGASVIGLGRRPQMAIEAPEGLKTYLANTNLLDASEAEQAVQSAKPDRVFHLAAEASLARSWEHPEKIMTSNLISSLNLLEAVRRRAPEARLLLAGSAEEYGPPTSLPIDETQPLRPQSPYAVSKAAVDLAGGFYADAYGMTVVRTRAFNHAGPWQSTAYLVSSFASQIAKAEAEGAHEVEVRTGSLELCRDFTDVRDVAYAYWLALERGESDTYNVCSGMAIAGRDIFDKLARQSEISVHHRTDPMLLREDDVPEVVGSNRRLRAATGWEPQKTVNEMLSDTLDWWRQRAKAEAQG